MCYSWVHATCEGLKKDQYKQFTQLTNTITNIAYYCTLNQCASLNKKLIYDHLSSLKQNADTTTLRSLKVEQTNLHHTISDVSNKLDDLFSQNRNKLKMYVSKTLASKVKLQVPPNLSQTTASTSKLPTTAVLSIADELADREWRKSNLIIYNLPEPTNNSKDKSLFTELSKSVFDTIVKITKSLRLGKKLK